MSVMVCGKATGNLCPLMDVCKSGKLTKPSVWEGLLEASRMLQSVDDLMHGASGGVSKKFHPQFESR